MVAFLKTAVFLSARKIMLTAGYFLQLPSIIYIPAELFCTFRNKVSIIMIASVVFMYRKLYILCADILILTNP